MRLVLFKNPFTALRARVSNTFTLPERFKGTIVEKWAKYWKGLVSDYADVGRGIIKESYTKPRKAITIGGTIYLAYLCGERNPDEDAFVRTIRKWQNKMIVVPKHVQRTESAEYLRRMEAALNHNKIRLLSLGIFSLVWLDIYDQDDCTYPANCEFTTVDYTNFFERIIDVGFWDKFWRLEKEMLNYDINYL